MKRTTVLAILKTHARRRNNISRKSLNLLLAEIADGNRAVAAYVDAHNFTRLVGEAYEQLYREWLESPTGDLNLKFSQEA